MTDSNAEDIKQKSKKVDEIFDNYRAKFKEFQKKKIEILTIFGRKTDAHKMDKLRKEIEGL
ncbi:MAG: hypothetical protein WCI57_03840 [Candidatus Berkelbacteria bacterium]